MRESADMTPPESAPLQAKDPGTDPWLQGRDVLVTGLIVLFWLIGLLTRQKSWLGWARRFAGRRLSSTARLEADEIETVRVVVGQGDADWIEHSFRHDWLTHKYHSWIQLLACYRPWRWRPRPHLIGRQHLDDALARGQGVILLTANFVYKDLMTKVALADAGLPLIHLARDSHGFAESKLGRRLLNPVYVGIERRFLRERLVFSGDRTKQVNALIRQRLKDNQPIMVTVTPLGRKLGILPFLHGRIRIATGALNFACEAGAVVLPVFTIRKPDGTFETIVEHPLQQPADGTRSEMINAMLEDYVPRLETYVAQYPDQFAFPTSARHGHALIEPLPSSARPAVTRPARPAAPAPVTPTAEVDHKIPERVRPALRVAKT